MKIPLKSQLSKIFMSGEENDAINYRPVSLFSNFKRIFEKIMFKQNDISYWQT